MKKFQITLTCILTAAVMFSLGSCNKSADTFIDVDCLDLQFDNTGQEEELITVESNCEWAVSVSDPSWINAEKLNSATLKVSAAPNILESAQREGTIEIIPDNGDIIRITVSQIAGYTINGKWQATDTEFSTDLETWEDANDYLAMGIEMYYTFNISDNTIYMNVVDPIAGDSQEATYAISSYDHESRVFVISDGTTESTYTIWDISDTCLEFYAYSDFSENYLKINCRKVTE